MNPFEKLSMLALGRKTAEEAKQSRKFPLVIILEDIRSMHNVGAIFRTADALAISELCLVGITGQPPHREIHKTALGAEYSVAWRHETEITTALESYKASGYTLLALEQTKNSTPLHQWPIEVGGQYALVVGNEVSGVSETALSLCDTVLEIPQFGAKHSLNVGVATSIVCWHFVQRQLSLQAG